MMVIAPFLCFGFDYFSAICFWVLWSFRVVIMV